MPSVISQCICCSSSRFLFAHTRRFLLVRASTFSVSQVRHSKLSQAQIWRFGSDSSSPDVFRGVTGGADAAEPSDGAWVPLGAAPLVPGLHLPPHLCRHRRFPQDFFPVHPSWSRKGFLHTRWQLAGRPVDLCNVHLFHDDSNLTALQRNPSEPREADLSVFATYRLRASCAIPR